MTEPHETFTWYDTKPYIKKCDEGWMIEDTSVYLARRNKRIAIRRALQILGALAIVWGMVWITL